MPQKPGEKALKEQVKFLMGQLRIGAVNIHQFMKLLEMAYGDYLDFHPEERPSYYDKPDIKPETDTKE